MRKLTGLAFLIGASYLLLLPAQSAQTRYLGHATTPPAANEPQARARPQPTPIIPIKYCRRCAQPGFKCMERDTDNKCTKWEHYCVRWELVRC